MLKSTIPFANIRFFDDTPTVGDLERRFSRFLRNLREQRDTALRIETKTEHRSLAFVAEIEMSKDTLPSKWPEEIVSEDRDLYCSDFPQGTQLDEHRWTSLPDFEASMAFQWLLKSTLENGGSASFGYLSQKLHNDVYDDPTPYRRAIKDLLANLL